MINEQFKKECSLEIKEQSLNIDLKNLTKSWFSLANKHKYSYHFDFLGRPLIQYPQDIVQIQSIIYEVSPDLIIETGIAHGGSLILSASMLCLLDIIDGLDPRTSHRKVLGIDIEIRPHNKKAIENHPLSFKIHMIEGSSIDPGIINKVKDFSSNFGKKLVFLDSNHTHSHVLKELNAYAPLVSKGSYCVVFDTVIEDLPKEVFPDRPWGPGDNPKTAVWEFLQTNKNFEIDKTIQDKLLITVAPDGFLRRVL